MCELAAVFSFDGPLISGVMPINLGIDASARFLTILGSNFGTSPAVNAQIRIGNMQCDLPTWMSSSSIRCSVSDRLLQADHTSILMNGLVGTSGGIVLFSFDAPRIDSMLPANAPTTAAVNTMLFGVNLLPVRMYATALPRVTLGQTDCGEVSYITPTKISCLVGAGTGAGLGAVVRLNGVGATTAAIFKYDAPVITSMLPTNLPYTAKASSVTLAGTNFGSTGLSPPQKAVSADDRPCEQTAWISTTSLACQLGVLGVFEYRVDVAAVVDGLSGRRQFFMSWDSPVISSASPPNVPATGGISVTISGINFGLPNSPQERDHSARNQLPQPVNWTLPPYLQPFAHVSGTSIALLPAPGGSGDSQPVFLRSVDVPAREIGAGHAFSIAFNDPVVTTFRPTNAAVFGGVPLTVLGTNFGASKGGERASLSVRIGSSDCAQITYVSNTALTCNVPAGNGEVSVRLGIGSGSRSSEASQTFAYNDDHEYSCGPYGPCSHSCTPDDGSQPMTSRKCVCIEALTSLRLDDDFLCAAQSRPVEVRPCPFVQCPPLLLALQPSSPLPNSPVTLIGRYFANVSSPDIRVLIGLTSCSEATWLSASSIACLAPFVSGGMGTTVQLSVGGAKAQHIAAVVPVAMLAVTPTAVEVNPHLLSPGGYAQTTLSWQAASGALGYEPEFRVPVRGLRRRAQPDGIGDVVTIPDNAGCLLNGTYEPSDAVCRDPQRWATAWTCFPTNDGGCLRLASDQLNFTIPDQSIPLAPEGDKGRASIQVLLRIVACTSSQGQAKAVANDQECAGRFVVSAPVAWTPQLLQSQARVFVAPTHDWPEWPFTLIPVAILLTLIVSIFVYVMTVVSQCALPGGCCLFGLLESVQLVALLCQTCIFQDSPGLAKLAHALRWYNLQIPDRLFGQDFLASCSVDQCTRSIDAKWFSYSGAAWLSSSILVAAALGASALLSLILYLLRCVLPSEAFRSAISRVQFPRLQLAVLVLGFNSQVLTSSQMISTEISRFDSAAFGHPIATVSTALP
jgi:hypothetical protein